MPVVNIQSEPPRLIILNSGQFVYLFNGQFIYLFSYEIAHEVVVHRRRSIVTNSLRLSHTKSLNIILLKVGVVAESLPPCTHERSLPGARGAKPPMNPDNSKCLLKNFNVPRERVRVNLVLYSTPSVFWNLITARDDNPK